MTPTTDLQKLLAEASASDLLAIEAAKNKRARKQIKRKGPDHDQV
jgi:hypothetical protein